MTTQTSYRAVLESRHQDDREFVSRATAAVLHALRDRLTSDEADQVFAQLPGELRPVWAGGGPAERAAVTRSREAFYDRVMQEAWLSSERQARWLVLSVFAALKDRITPDEADDIVAQLPRDLKETWAEATGGVP